MLLYNACHNQIHKVLYPQTFIPIIFNFSQNIMHLKNFTYMVYELNIFSCMATQLSINLIQKAILGRSLHEHIMITLCISYRSSYLRCEHIAIAILDKDNN